MDVKDVEMKFTWDKPKSGAWHTGPNPCWITLTHKPTMNQVTLYSGDQAQNRVRDEAFALLEMAVEFGRCEHAMFPENVHT